MPFMHCLVNNTVRFAAVFLCLGVLTSSCTLAATKPVQDKTTLQKEQRSIKGQINSIKQDLSRKEARLDQVNQELSVSEKAISLNSRELKELGTKREELERKLSGLAQEVKRVNTQVKDAEGTISVISQAQFVNSRRHPWQAVLSGSNPNEIARSASILRYMEREQSRAIDQLENKNKTNEALMKKNTLARQELTQVELSAKKKKESLENEKSRREVALQNLKKEINTQRERYEQLVKNDQQLTELITNIDKEIARAAEKARKERALEAARKAQSASRRGSAQSTPPRRTPDAPALGNFGKLRGKLTMPTKGEIIARFGQKREGAASALTWRGLLIRARMGEDVLAVAAGTVVFSDWMRGFGNLLIIDHGTNYLSVYANNETLYKSVGDRVSKGETIASVGKSGGEDSPGLYFELRYKGKPFDPTPWISPVR